MQDFRNLKVWQRAHELTLLIYKLTIDFPREELFGLRNSLRKTCVDIPAFIAEGCGKPTDSEFAKSLFSALGFTNRLEYYALLAFELEMFSEADYKELNNKILEVKKMLHGFNQRLR